MVRPLLLALALAGALGGAACATVQPWQRGRLANPAMQFDPDGGLADYAGHWLESREGASGGADTSVSDEEPV